MLSIRVFVGLLCLVLVAACATTATNTLSQAKRDALRIDAIELSFAPDAEIFWLDALNDFGKSGALDAPEARRAFLEQKASPHVRAALDAALRPAFRGTDPPRLVVVVWRLEVPSAVQRLLIGGHHFLNAEIRVVDIKTGQTLVAAPDFKGHSAGGAGLIQLAVEQLLPDPINRVSNAFAKALKVWLQTGQAVMG